LKYSDDLLEKRYGTGKRLVPAHAPYIAQKSLMEEFFKIWDEEFEKTSSIKIRGEVNALIYFM